MAEFLGPRAARNQSTLKLGTQGSTYANTTELVVMQVKVRGGTFAAGSLIKFAATFTTSNTSAATVRLRIGSAGTTSDSCVQQFSTTASVNASTWHEGMGQITATGASATFIAECWDGNSFGNFSLSNNSTSSGTFNSANDMWVSMTIQNGSNVTRTLRAGYIEVIHP